MSIVHGYLSRNKAFLLLFVFALSGCDFYGGGTSFKAPVSEVLPNKLIQPNPKKPSARNLLYKNDQSVSYCESSLEGLNNYSGFRDHTLYPLASVSKVFLSAFALDRLGADFKFNHDWKIKKNIDGSFDAYLNSNFDPVFNIEKALFTMAKLRDLGVTKIRHLYVSPSTRVYLSVLNNPHIELETIPVSIDQSIHNLKIIFNSINWGAQTNEAKNNLENYFSAQGKSFQAPKSFSLQNVTLDSTGEMAHQFTNGSKLRIPSSSLFRYLKEINVNSNNYMSDALFALLGGKSEFAKFQKQKLGLGFDSLLMYTGSGLPIVSNGERIDNLGTCFSILKVMHFVKLISEQANLDLGYVLLTAGSDQGTFETDLLINKSVVLKTGRLYDVPTLNLSGIASTQKGLMAFAFLGHGFSNNDEKIQQQKRDDLLADLLQFYREKPLFKTLSQNEIFFLN